MGDNVNQEEYKELVKKHTYKENPLINLFKAFIFGGLMGIIGQGITDFFYKYLEFSIQDSYMFTMVVLVIIAAILTGLGFFDKVVAYARCGLIVPTTGFAHAMTSAAMDYKQEGFVKGIGANFFKLTGSIILFGIVISFFVALLKVVIG